VSSLGKTSQQEDFIQLIN